MSTAIYCRQSIERQDSVSIETQIAQCRNLCSDAEIYSDAGYSGKNLNRPAFECLLDDIKSGKVNRVVSYRLDRISRSITDFANLLTLFEKYKVDYTSATEQFDTSTPIGKAMVYIVMVFAQLERETITKRITDNYFYRAKQGLYTGGNVPLGYNSARVLEGTKNISIFKIDEKSSWIVKKIFEDYAVKNYSVSSISMALNTKEHYTQEHKPWSVNKVKNILKNPVYVAADSFMYEYAVSQGYQIANAPSEFDGINGLTLYGKNVGKHTPTENSQQILAIGKHQPLIRSDVFLSAQHKLNLPKKPKRSGTGKASWLSGLVLCAECGYAFTTKISTWQGKTYKQLHCTSYGRRGLAICNNGTFFRLQEIEDEVENHLFAKLKAFSESPWEFYTETVSAETNIKRSQLTAELLAVNTEIENLIKQLGNGTVIDKYIKEKLIALDLNKTTTQQKLREIDDEIQHQNRSALNKDYLIELATNSLNIFQSSDVENKKHIAKNFIKKIKIGKQSLSIDWLI